MNEQLQQELLKIVTNINDGATSVWGFITDQTPDVIQQLMLWHGVESFLWFLLCCLSSIILLFTAKKIKKWSDNYIKEEKPYDPSGYYCMWISVLILGALVFIFNLKTNIVWLQIWIAPKVWLLEYITAMVK